MLKIILWGIGVLVFISVFAYLFSTPVATNECAKAVLACLQENARLLFLEKMSKGFACLYQNVVCVIKQ